MSALTTVLYCVGALTLITIFYAGLFFISSQVSRIIKERRYKKENDIGRNRYEFARSFRSTGEDERTGMDSQHEQLGNIQEPVDSSVSQDESEPRDDRKSDRVRSNDYEQFRKQFLN